MIKASGEDLFFIFFVSFLFLFSLLTSKQQSKSELFKWDISLENKILLKPTIKKKMKKKRTRILSYAEIIFLLHDGDFSRWRRTMIKKNIKKECRKEIKLFHLVSLRTLSKRVQKSPQKSLDDDERIRNKTHKKIRKKSRKTINK